jgi:hypothetical protein
VSRARVARSVFGALSLAGVALASSGCLLIDMNERDRDPPPRATPVAPAPADAPPKVELIDIPDWPPLGERGKVNVQASDDRGLSRIEFKFARESSVQVRGSFASASALGSSLGEGFGELVVRAVDFNNGFAERKVEDLLIDLTPPKVEIGRTVLPARGSDARLDLWVADAWVLGKVTLEFAGVELVHEFDPGYPDGIGKEWDQSIVSFDVTKLPPGRATAWLTVSDAAGNVFERDFSLHVDAVAPDVRLARPLAGARVSGRFEVEISTSGTASEPVWIELFAGGARSGEVMAAPTAVVALDAREFTPGALALEAVAHDEAGNSARTSIALVVERAAGQTP